MPKILLGVSNSFCANFLKGEVEFLVKNGWEVVIISGSGPEIAMLAETEKAKLYTAPFTKSMLPFKDIVCFFRIVHILQKEKPDIVNAGNPKSGFLVMLACAWVHQQKRMFTLHGMVSDTRSGIVKSLIRLSEKITCSIARKVLVVSPSLMQHAIEQKIMSPARGVVIGHGSYSGVNTNLFSRNQENREGAAKIRQEANIPTGAFVLGFVGRLSKDKGIDLLFDCFNRLREKYPGTRMVIAGPIEKENPFSKKYLHQLHTDEDITYLGKVMNVAPVYLLMDLLLLTSYREGFGNVLIEAAAMQVPVIAPDLPGCRDALQAGFNGSLFRKGDVDHLVSVVENYYRDSSLRELHGRNGREFVERNFRQENMLMGHLRLYRELLIS